MSDEVLVWLSVWSEVQMICIWFSWCHCHSIIFCSVNIQNGFTLFTFQVVLESRPLKGCLSVSWICFGCTYMVSLSVLHFSKPLFLPGTSQNFPYPFDIVLRSLFSHLPLIIQPTASNNALASFHWLWNWLRASEHIKFKLVVIVYRALHGTAPPYLSDLLCNVAADEKSTLVVYFQTSWRPPFTTSHCR